MALRIDFVGTIIWTVVLVGGLYLLRIFLPRYYCPGAIALFVVILLVANRRVIASRFRRRGYY